MSASFATAMSYRVVFNSGIVRDTSLTSDFDSRSAAARAQFPTRLLFNFTAKIPAEGLQISFQVLAWIKVQMKANSKSPRKGQ